MENELKKKIEANDFLLHSFIDREDENHRKYALFKYNESQPLTEEQKESILGKRHKSIASHSELERAVKLEHVRDYIYTTQHTEELLNDFFVAIPRTALSTQTNHDNKNEVVRFLPISSKIGLLKKKRHMKKD